MISACKSTKKTANSKVFPHSFTLFKSFRNCKMTSHLHAVTFLNDMF